MAVVFIPALLRNLSGGKASLEVAGATVREVVANLEQACPGISARLLDGERLKSNIQVAVDGAVSPAGLRQKVAPASEVHFVSAISGGRGAPIANRRQAASLPHRVSGGRCALG